MATAMTPCIGHDPGCPCQDGLACHYVDLPGSPAWPVPRHQPSGDHPPSRPPERTAND